MSAWEDSEYQRRREAEQAEQAKSDNDVQRPLPIDELFRTARMALIYLEEGISPNIEDPDRSLVRALRDSLLNVASRRVHTLGRIAHDSYFSEGCRQSGGLQSLESWETLTPRGRERWEAAAQAVAEEIQKKQKDD